MKKVLSIVAVAALSAAFVSCGPSKEEIEAREKAKADSVAAVAQAQADSLAKVAEAEAAAGNMQLLAVAYSLIKCKHDKPVDNRTITLQRAF